MTELKDPITTPPPTEISPVTSQRIPEKPLTRRSRIKTFRDLLRSKDDQIAQQTQIAEANAEQSLIDELTGLPNLRAFNQKLEESTERVRRFGGKSTVVILDADKLKLINDTQGHEAGNKYLRSIAEAMRKGKRRDTDAIFRIGGDEYAMILEGTDLEGAETMWNDTLNPAFVERNIAISGGAAEIDPKDMMLAKEKADSAMYGAKRDPERRGENLLFTYHPATK